MLTLRVHQDRAMLHLLKFAKTTNISRHLFSCLDCLSVKTAGCTSSIEPLLSRVSCSHLHSQRVMNLEPQCCNSITYKPSYYEKVILKNIQTSIPYCVPTRCKQTSTTEHLLVEAIAKEYITLYLQKQIKFLRVLCSAAKYSTLMFMTATPICAAGLLLNMLTQDLFMVVISTLLFYSVLFSSQSYFLLAKILCKVMISTDESYVKISHLTMFGYRKDLYVKPSDIIPLSGSLYDKHFHTIRFKNSSKKLLFLPHQGGDDTNYEVLEALFTKHGIQKETEPKE